MLNKLKVTDLDVAGKRVFCRVDFNVPRDNEGKVTDNTRIIATLPTIQMLIERGARVILASHMGRPKGIPKEEFSLRGVAPQLADLLGKPVVMAPDCIGPEVEKLVAAMHVGDVLLLENVRFHKGETDNDPAFAKQLAALADVYVNNAFGTAHRAHASTEGITHFLPQSACGLLLEKEIHYLGQALSGAKKPFVAILGGAKVSDKIPVIESLLDKIDTLLIGGGMAYTFLKAKGFDVGASLVEAERLELAERLMIQAAEKGVEFLLPTDHVIADRFAADAQSKICANGDFADDWMALDIGPQTIECYAHVLSTAATVIWNGPMGVFEFPAFSKGTFAIARALAEADNVSIVGGGDSVAAVTQAGLSDRMTHISTGGGASLEFLEGKQLPGIAALSDCK
ncbi:MAG: phosphoglycerate kinase [Desulfuromonadales bacterium]|nr:phosphoglycerate kinase [Desulfuromonadales bacterium]